MARYQVILAYDGTGFTGSQIQANSRTVQGELERALRNLGWSDRTVIMAGRTDTGVHATGQVAAFDFEWEHPADKLRRALNADLPPDLVIKDLIPAPADFHPRFDAVSREYRYRVFFQPTRDPLQEKYLWRAWPDVDGDALKQNAGIFLGTHDFAAIGSPMKPAPRGTTVRTLTKAEWKRMPDGEWQFEVRADAFLYRMVRRLVFVQVSVAQGRCPLEKVQHALSKQGKLLAGLAPAHGLTLVEVTYGSRDYKVSHNLPT
ncbi:MAG: tRNA pseudouridine(38-40) synthase TruA [Chloroflexi bacterium]|nr:tRNA pseudouridine(38-40) synthase TruA [Chloroflexota bacterium]